MKISEVPINTLLELRFNYLGVNHKVRAVLLYKNVQTVYVSAIRNAGKTVPASKLKNVSLIYKTNAGIYLFKEIYLRSISYNGQNLYVVQTEHDAHKVTLRSTARLFVGARVAARIIEEKEDSPNYLNCILKDINMNGMSILSNKEIDKLAKIEISFRVNEESNESLIGSIVHAFEFANGKGFLYVCEFEEPNDTIGKYVAMKQEKMKNKNDAN